MLTLYAQCHIIKMMKIVFDMEKNELIKKKRGITFEKIEKAIREGNLLAIIDHPNQTRYPCQKLFIVAIKNYACVVPYIETNDTVFLKTAFFSRKYTKLYIKERRKSL